MCKIWGYDPWIRIGINTMSFRNTNLYVFQKLILILHFKFPRGLNT